MSSIRLRVNGLSVASVNETLLTFYQQHTANLSDVAMSAIIKSIIERNLLYRSIESEKDIEEAKKLASYALFDSIGEWVEYWIHEQIKGIIPICRNCSYRRDNDYCPILNAFINPNSESCSTFK